MTDRTHPDSGPGAAYAALPEPLEIDWPELHSQALGCGVEDRGLHNRYECAEYGWQDGVDKCAERVPDQIFDADQMRAFADATCAMRASHGQAPAPATQQAGEREQERIAFKDAHRHLELYEVPDAWGRPMFKHSHVETSWLGWIARAARAPADSVLDDAARYRLVRRGQHWSVINGIGNGLRAEELDAAVDAARAAQEGANHE